MTDILAVSELRKSFGALRVADRISFVVREGEILGIIGPNGAGKTTLFGLLAGNIRADSGRIEFDGADVTHLPAHDRARAGLARTYQIPRPFTHMTVFDNLLVAARFGGDMDEAEATTWVERVIGAMGLRAERNTLAGATSWRALLPRGPGSSWSTKSRRASPTPRWSSSSRSSAASAIRVLPWCGSST